MKCRVVIVFVILLLPIFPRWVFAAPMHTGLHAGPPMEGIANGAPDTNAPSAILRPRGAVFLAQNTIDPEQEAGLFPLNSLPPQSELYEVRHSDTLWSLAKQFRPQGASVQQTMLAIMHLNAHAFENNNGNRLNSGSLLSLPSLFDTQSISSPHALEEIKRRYAIWAEHQGISNPSQAIFFQPLSLMSKTDIASSPVSSAKTPDPLLVFDNEPIRQNAEITKKAPSFLPTTGTSEERDVLIRTEAGITKPGEDHSSAAQGRVRDAGERGEKIIDRIVALEATIAELRDVASAQSTEIMALRRDLLSLTATPLSAPNASLTSFPLENALSAADKTLSPGSPAVLDSRTFIDKLRVQLDKLPGGTIGILSSTGVLLIIVTLIVWLLRRRSTSANDTRVSTPAEVVTDEVHSVQDTPKITQHVVLPDITPTEVDSDEVLAEVNVYLAYERYEQAESLAREALLKEPENSTFRLKLLEILYHLKDINAFREVLVELQAQVGDKSPLWALACRWEGEMVFADSLSDKESDSALIVALELVDERSAESTEKEFTALFSPVPSQERELDNRELDGFKKGVEPPNRDAVAVEETKVKHSDNYQQGFISSANKLASIVSETQGMRVSESAPKCLQPQLPTDSPVNTRFSSESTFATRINLEAKLSLARAYFEIGDKDGGREILEEILYQGSEAQRNQAEFLLKSQG